MRSRIATNRIRDVNQFYRCSNSPTIFLFISLIFVSFWRYSSRRVFSYEFSSYFLTFEYDTHSLLVGSSGSFSSSYFSRIYFFLLFFFYSVGFLHSCSISILVSNSPSSIDFLSTKFLSFNFSR